MRSVSTVGRVVLTLHTHTVLLRPIGYGRHVYTSVMIGYPMQIKIICNILAQGQVSLTDPSVLSYLDACALVCLPGGIPRGFQIVHSYHGETLAGG